MPWRILMGIEQDMCPPAKPEREGERLDVVGYNQVEFFAPEGMRQIAIVVNHTMTGSEKTQQKKYATDHLSE
jgi:hypothetical protein